MGRGLCLLFYGGDFSEQKISGLEQRPTEKMQKLFGRMEGCGIKMGRAVKQDCG